MNNQYINDEDSLDSINIQIKEEYSGYIGVRIDKCLAELMNEFSRSYIAKLMEEGQITVNSKAVKANYKLRDGDNIEIIVPEPEELEILPENIPLDIVYEDDDILIVNKPKGMVVHPAPGHSSGTLVNAIMYHCKDSLSTINGVLRPGIVHRIDMDTTGLLMVCKNDVAHRVMSDKFKVHDINRVYTAICYNHFTDVEGTVDKPIARHKVDRKKMSIDSNGRRAVTHYKVIEELSNNFSLIECRLETGRTHQIRVHMASINHPLLGDEVYGPKNKPFKTEGQVLHAGVLGFEHPITGEYMEFKAELPEYFNNILERLRK
ncbi:MAG: RluA family pseudouridine synthase [Lachnospiraceae bacterium]|nr:RluA family pseudouridine synthase [Lachnospiraceae bacterium]